MEQVKSGRSGLSGAAALLLVGTFAACHDATGPAPAPAPAPAPSIVKLAAVTPSTGLAGVVGTRLVAPIVRATDENGVPLRAVAVTFATGLGEGTVEQESAMTDANGLASAGTWTLGLRAGPQSLVATANGGAPPVVFVATALPGPVDRVVRVEGDNQPGLAGDTLPDPLVARVVDSFENPIAGAVFTFTVVSGDGIISGDRSTTDSRGLATSGPWKLGPTIGRQQVRAQSEKAQVLFSATACESLGKAACEFIGVVRTLAFVRNGRIYRVNSDGSDLIELTNGATDDSPAWSPDGSRIVFTRRINGNSGIYVMNADGSNVIRLPGIGGSSPAWSPDGRKIAFNGTSSTMPYRSAIYVVSPDNDSESPVELSRGWLVTWTPDGRIAANERGNIVIINADGTNEMILASVPGAWYDEVVWSPDGNNLAVTVSSDCNWADECHTSIRILDGRSPEITKVKSLVACAPPDYCHNPVWSPFGTRIAFTLSRGYDNSIAYVATEGGAPQVIVANGSDPSWRP